MNQTGARVLRWADDVLLVAGDTASLSQAREKAMAALPCRMVFRENDAREGDAVQYLGWALTPSGEWWPASGRWDHLCDLVEDTSGTAEEIQGRMKGWIAQHALEPLTVVELYQRLPQWRRSNHAA